jgi:hypothetical protein
VAYVDTTRAVNLGTRHKAGNDEQKKGCVRR